VEVPESGQSLALSLNSVSAVLASAESTVCGWLLKLVSVSVCVPLVLPPVCTPKSSSLGEMTMG